MQNVIIKVLLYLLQNVDRTFLVVTLKLLGIPKGITHKVKIINIIDYFYFFYFK